MSGYPPNNTFGYPSNQPQPGFLANPLLLQPYPNTSAPGCLPNSSYPYPNQQPIMNCITGYPAPTGYPNPPTVSPSYPSTGGYPNSGGYSNASRYPVPGTVPDSAGGVSNPEFNPAFSPTAPNLCQVEKIPGYENATVDKGIVMPPPTPDWQQKEERKQIENLPSLSEEDVREAVLEYVSDHCCYGSKPAKNMVINGITMMSAFHYKLETFTEKRETAIRFKPYSSGEPIDGPENGPTPRPWDILATPNVGFSDSKMKIELPHTAFVKICNKCAGKGQVHCDSCQGRGKSKCVLCKGQGTTRLTGGDHPIYRECSSCEGTGISSCRSCQGRGQKTCKTCDGEGQLKGFKELTVTWTNHADDYISETSKLPKKLIRDVTGQVAFEEEYFRVSPIAHSSDKAVCDASKKFIKKHSTAFQNERILNQRHSLRLIPIGEINYKWKAKSGVFYVYGYEHKVYFDDYPQQCCCCTII